MKGKYFTTIYNNVESPQSRQASQNNVGTLIPHALSSNVGA